MDVQDLGEELAKLVLKASASCLLKREEKTNKENSNEEEETANPANVSENTEVAETNSNQAIFPNADDILNSLGLGPNGPPLQPTTMFRVAKYPENRMLLKKPDQTKFSLSTDVSDLLAQMTSTNEFNDSSSQIDVNGPGADAVSVKTTSTKKSSGKVGNKGRKTSANTKSEIGRAHV